MGVFLGVRVLCWHPFIQGVELGMDSDTGDLWPECVVFDGRHIAFSTGVYLIWEWNLSIRNGKVS